MLYFYTHPCATSISSRAAALCKRRNSVRIMRGLVV